MKPTAASRTPMLFPCHCQGSTRSRCAELRRGREWKGETCGCPCHPEPDPVVERLEDPFR